jgi:hypothetical protein
MMAGAGGAMRATGWRATAIRFQQFGSDLTEGDAYIMAFTDHFSSLASRYAEFRPTYTPALFAWLADIVPALSSAVSKMEIP